MARYIDADELIRLLEIDAVCEGDCFSKRSAIKSVKVINTADVVPRAALEYILSDLKKEIHDKAVYPQGVGGGVKPYITLKVVDAIINNKVEEINKQP